MRLRRAQGIAALHTLDSTLTRLARGTGPILVGPWLTEVGYELLYWIPFLAWAQATYGLDPSRCVAISRGGCAAWYAHVAARYLDVLSWVTPETYRRANETRMRIERTAKHFAMGAFDQDLLRRATAIIGDEAEVLHPSVMYRCFLAHKPWSATWQDHVHYRPFAPVEPWPGLPDRYVAARFYSSAICPDTPAVRAVLIERLRTLAQMEDVVWLTSGTRLDDHDDLAVAAVPRVHRLEAVTPETNLAMQTRVIAGASRFVGTYGGFAYLAPLLGVDAETVYAQPMALHKLRRHVPIAQRVFSGPPFGTLTITTLNTPSVEYACA